MHLPLCSEPYTPFMVPACPHCNLSDQARRAAAVVAEQTAKGRTDAFGLGIAMSGTASLRSELADGLAPPRPPSEAHWIWGVGGVATIGFAVALSGVLSDGYQAIAFLILFAGAGMVLLGLGIAFKRPEDRARYRAARAEWERLWYCGRCHTTFRS